MPMWPLKVCSFAALLFVFISTETVADSVCGPGRRMVDNAWACGPDNRAQGSTAPRNHSNQIAAGIALGGALFSIVEALASQSRLTDDVSSINPILQQHANLSVEYNRRGFSLQHAGRYNEARIAFLKAAQEASNGGSAEDAITNNRNANIADALNWLRQGYNAEKAGQKTKANVAYSNGINVARSAGLHELAAQLERANSSLVRSSRDKGMIDSKSSCMSVNGQLACF